MPESINIPAITRFRKTIISPCPLPLQTWPSRHKFFRKLAIKSVLFLPIHKISQYLHVLLVICDGGFSRCALAMLYQLNCITTVQVHDLIDLCLIRLPPSPWIPSAGRASMDRKSRILVVSFFNYIMIQVISHGR